MLSLLLCLTLGAVVGAVSGAVLLCEGGCQLPAAWGWAASIAGSWCGHPVGLPAWCCRHVPSYQHLPRVPQREGLCRPVWTLKLSRWGSHSIPPVLRLGLPLCLMPTVQGSPPHAGHEHGHLHTPQETLAPQARLGTTEQAQVRSRLALWMGLGPGLCVGFAQ